MKISLKLLAVPLAVGVLAFAGCGSSSDDSSSSSESSSNGTTTAQPAENNTASGQENAQGTIDVAANPSGELAFDPDQLSGKAGKVKVDFTNDSPLEHDIVIDAPDGKEVAKTPVFNGGSKQASFDAKPGTYTFYCSVPGHREGGMEGTLTIK